MSTQCHLVLFNNWSSQGKRMKIIKLLWLKSVWLKGEKSYVYVKSSAYQITLHTLGLEAFCHNLKYKFFTNHNSIPNVLYVLWCFLKFYQIIDSFTTEFLLFKKYLNHYPTKCSETQVPTESQCAYTAFVIIIMVVSRMSPNSS